MCTMCVRGVCGGQKGLRCPDTVVIECIESPQGC